MIIGYEVTGLLGSFVSVLGCALPPLIIMSFVTYFYQIIVANKYVKLFMQGMQAGVIAMLIDVLLSLFINLDKKNQYLTYAVSLISFLYVYFTKYSILYLIVFCIVVGYIKSILIKKKVENQ